MGTGRGGRNCSLCKIIKGGLLEKVISGQKPEEIGRALPLNGQGIQVEGTAVVMMHLEYLGTTRRPMWLKQLEPGGEWWEMRSER